MNRYLPLGADNPLGTKFWCQQKGLFSLPICCKFQNDLSSKSDFIHIFNDFIRVYSPRARTENPLGTNFWCQQKVLITSTICCKFQTNLFEFWFYTHFLNVFSHVYSPGAGPDNLLWTKSWWQQKAFSLCPYVASFKMISSKSDFIHISNDFIHVYSPRARTENPLGTNFWCQQKVLITSTICCKFQTNLFEFWFYTHFLMFFHMYSPGAGPDNPLWTKSWCQQKSLVTLPICCKYKKNIFEVWFYTYFCLFLYMNITPGQGQTTPWVWFDFCFYGSSTHLRSVRAWSVNLATLFLGKPPQQFTST